MLCTLRIAAANLTDKESIAGYVSRLATGNRLAALRVDGDERAAVSAAFSLSYAALATGTRRMFRLLGLVYGPEITVEAAAALADIRDGEARRQLETLVAAHLVEHRATGRYACHDLLRLFAAEHVDAEEPEADRAAAAARLRDYYVTTANQASRLISPHALRLPARDALGTSHLPDAPAALGWLDSELANLAAIAEYCGEYGPRRVAWLLADATRAFFFRRSYFATISSGRLRSPGKPGGSKPRRPRLAGLVRCTGAPAPTTRRSNTSAARSTWRATPAGPAPRRPRSPTSPASMSK